MSPARTPRPSHRSFADPYGVINEYVEKTPRIVPVWQKIRQSIPLLIKFINATTGGTVYLHASQIRLKQSIIPSHPPSSISPSPISPSLIPPSTNPLSCLLGQFDY